jgi:hypothetical protein
LNRGTPQSPNFQLYSNSFVANPNFVISAIPTLADINGDGLLDLFVSDNDGHFFYYRNIGTPHWPNFVLQSDNWQGIGSTDVARMGSFADIDGDGDQDFIASNDSGYHVVLYRNQGSSTDPLMVLQPGSLISPIMPGEVWMLLSPVLGDIDADGDYDLFVGNGSGNAGIMFFRNITNEGVNPDPKYHPLPQRQITILPNPGNSGTTISYVLSHPQHVNLSVYNLLGSRLATLVDGLQQPGSHVSSWEAKDKAAGVYLVRLEAEGEVLVMKAVIIK